MPAPAPPDPLNTVDFLIKLGRHVHSCEVLQEIKVCSARGRYQSESGKLTVVLFHLIPADIQVHFQSFDGFFCFIQCFVAFCHSTVGKSFCCGALLLFGNIQVVWMKVQSLLETPLLLVQNTQPTIHLSQCFCVTCLRINRQHKQHQSYTNKKKTQKDFKLKVSPCKFFHVSPLELLDILVSTQKGNLTFSAIFVQSLRFFSALSTSPFRSKSSALLI